MDLKKALPQVGEANKGALYLVGGLTVFTAMLGTLGIAAEEIDDLFRDHQALSYLAVGGVIIGVAAGLLASYATGIGTDAEGRWLKVGLASLGIGLLAGACSVVASAGERTQPTAIASVTRTASATTLTANVSASGLRPSDNVAVVVEPLLLGSGERLEESGPIYTATLSPGDDGRVDEAIEVEIPPGNFREIGIKAWTGELPGNCYAKQSATGCFTLQLNRRPEPPQFDLAWKTRKSGRTELTFALQARDITGRELHYLLLGFGERGRVRLAEGRFYPSFLAKVEETLRVPVPPRVRTICLAASTSEPLRGCPERDSATTWLRSRVPGRG